MDIDVRACSIYFTGFTQDFPKFSPWFKKLSSNFGIIFRATKKESSPDFLFYFFEKGKNLQFKNLTCNKTSKNSFLPFAQYYPCYQWSYS